MNTNKEHIMRLSFTKVALFFLCIIFSYSTFAACRYSNADFSSILRCAEQQEIKAQLELGHRYLHGIGVAQSATEAMRWYQASANAGSPLGQYILGYLYQRGLGIRKSDATAVNWYLRAGEAGNVDAQYNFATLLLTSKEIQTHPDEAATWYRKAALAGDADAANNLGYLYETGSGVPQNLEQAKIFYRRAANMNHAVSQYNLGRLLFNDASPHTHQEAKTYLERSAKQGYAPAMAMLGQYYAENTPPDYKNAYFWLSLSNAFGNEAGKAGKTIVESHLSEEEMEEVYQQLQAFSLSGQTVATQSRRSRTRRR